MLKWLGYSVLASLALVTPTLACPAFPYPSFANGSTADANQVNSNFANVTNCFAPLNNPAFTGVASITGTAGADALDVVNGNMYVTGTSTGSFSNAFGIRQGIAINYIQVDNNGNTYFSSSHSANFVFSNGSACTLTPAASAPMWSCVSDISLKTNITDTAKGLGWFEGVRVRDFTMKATGVQQTGVIAQELAVRHPEMVHKGGDGLYAVESPNPWVLVKAIQEQQAEIDQLKADLAAVKTAK